MSERQEACWDLVTQMKGDVLALLDSENDGIRTHAIKFTESLIVTLSPRTAESDIPKRQESDISLDKVPKDHSYIRYGMDDENVLVDVVGSDCSRGFFVAFFTASLLTLFPCASADALCEEGKLALEKLLKFMIHPAISSINLTAVLGSLATVARQRPMFMSEVVQAYETLHGEWLVPFLACISHMQFHSFAFRFIPLCTHLFVANLPPTLAKSQVSSVRKNLKLHLVSVLKHPCSLEFQGQISTLLLDLGMPQSEITRSTPVPREPRKRPRHEQYTEGKKVKIGGCRLLSDVSAPAYLWMRPILPVGHFIITKTVLLSLQSQP